MRAFSPGTPPRGDSGRAVLRRPPCAHHDHALGLRRSTHGGGDEWLAYRVHRRAHDTEPARQVTYELEAVKRTAGMKAFPKSTGAREPAILSAEKRLPAFGPKPPMLKLALGSSPGFEQVVIVFRASANGRFLQTCA
jgi:hypothetical protein